MFALHNVITEPQSMFLGIPYALPKHMVMDVLCKDGN